MAMARFLKSALFVVGIALALQGFAQSTGEGIFGRQQSDAQQGQQASQSGSVFPGRGADEMPQTTLPTVITNRPRAGAATRPERPEGALDGAAEESRRGRAMRPAEREHNEFQEFVMQSIGRELPIFGHDLFRNVPSTFAPVENVPVTPDYVIGPGDEIVVRAWGQIDVDYSAIVDRAGAISIPKVGVLNVAGIKYQDLPAFLKSSFGRVFRNFELTASLGRLRSVQIFVVGQARQPGSYTVSSLSTLVNAVFAAGGPSSKGSMRSIQLKRGNRVVADLDLYDLLLAGDKSKDAQLLPGDVIYFPPVGPLAAITGSINVPAVYELRQDVPLADLVRWAGGLSTTAQGQKVMVERIEGRKARKVEEFSLDTAGMGRAVRDGDLVTVFALAPRFDNVVTLRGNVAQPGRFPWRDGMRLRDLIPEKEALLSREYMLRRNQIVGVDSNVARLLSEQDPYKAQLGLSDLTERKLGDGADPTIAEAVRRRQIERDALRLADQQRPANEAGRLVNQIRPSLKEVNWDYAVIERLNSTDLSTTLLPFNLGKAINGGDLEHNLLLRPGDVITIFSREDLQVPVQRQIKYVRLEGEFASPGIYQIQPGETLRQLVVRVGGLAPGAYLFGGEFTRESTRLTQSKQYLETINRLERDAEADASVRTRSTVSADEALSLTAQQAARRAQFARLRELRPSGRIVLELPASPVLADLPDIALEDNDRFYVPPPPSMVSIYGAVFTEASFLYRPGKSAADYITQAGGTNKRADTAQIFVLKADGSVVGSSRWFGMRSTGTPVMPGDTIVVPEDTDRTLLSKDLRDWTQIFYQFGLGAAGLKVLRQ